MAILNDIYDSPATILFSMRNALENDIVNGMLVIAHKHHIAIDETKLVQAIRQDKGRYKAAYQAGFSHGYMQARKELLKEGEMEDSSAT